MKPTACDSLHDLIIPEGQFPLWPVNRLFANFIDGPERVRALLRGAGIAPGCDTIGGRMATEELVRLLRQAAWAARDETWGLRPTATRLGTFKQACEIAVRGQTVAHGLRAAFRYYHGIADDFTIHLAMTEGQGTVIITDRIPDRTSRDVFHVFLLHCVFVLVEWLSGRSLTPDSICLRHAMPPHAAQLERVFRSPVSANASVTRLVLQAAVLRRPVVADVAQVRGLIDTLLAKVTRLVPDARGLSEKAAGYIFSTANWEVQRKEVAAVLGMSAATFDRRLHEEIGGGLQLLKDRLRRDAARKLMEVEGLTLEEIAHRLGFSELSSFHRAFKRWNGQAPGNYREQLRVSADD